VSASEPAIDPTTDTLILVDEQDNELGSCEKVDCHLGEGKLHRAFSVFLFDPEGRLLIQQRSPDKMLWGGFWANSCCSHPRLGESTTDAAHRRIKEELGISCELRYLYKFVYHAKFGDVGSEHENCYVYAGWYDGNAHINAAEISATRLLTPAELTAEIETNGEIYSPWLKLEWERICKDFLTDLV
jgi:isopentenyl-diphosphate delta-isomerase